MVARSSIGAGIAITAVLLVIFAVPAEGQVVRITATVLDVQHRVGPSGAWATSTVGVSLPAGSRVRTGKRARCEVTFPDGTKVRMGPRSDLVITDPATKRAKVVAGEVFAQVVAGTGGAQIQGATVTAAVRGTDLTFRVEDDGTMPDPDSPQVEEWVATDPELPFGHHTLAALPTGLLSGVPQQFPWGGNIWVQAWFGPVDVTGPFGTIPLGPGMGGLFGPAGGPAGFNTFNAFPHSFGTGSFQPFYSGWSSGSGVGVTPGSIGGQGFQNDQSGSRQQTGSFFDGPPRGAVDVVVQSKAAPAGASGSAHAQGLAAAAFGLAATGQIHEQELLGRHFFGPQYQVDLIALAHDGGSLGGGWLRASAVYENFYGEIGLQALTDFDGDDDLRISDLFLVNRHGDTDIIAGRQRWLHGPVNNSGLGSLFGVTHFDGISIDDTGEKLNTTLAWVDEFEAWGNPKVRRSGWLGRVSGEVRGGLLGANLLYSNDNLGWSVDASIPIFPRNIDLYVEVGRDHERRELSTVGLYSPALYRSSNIDLFVEYAHRDDYGAVWSAAAYWEATEGWTGLAGVRVPQGDNPELMLGVANRFGSLSPQ